MHDGGAMPIEITDGDALLVIDVQNDFCSGGALAVPNGEEAIPLVNRIAPIFQHVVLTQDWHPVGHMSFASSHADKSAYDLIEAEYGKQILWPDHCVQGTYGAAFYPTLDIPHAELILRKGFRRSIDSYSAFFENDHRTVTGLGGYLRDRSLNRILVCGLAYDFCVRYSAVDGKKLGFESLVIQDASKAIDLNGSYESATREFLQDGIGMINSFDLIVRQH
jgi:nicotinamidase/pyrazinamidase